MTTRDLLQQLAFLKRNETLSRTELLAQNLHRFHRFCREVIPQSPYYAGIVRSRGIDPTSCQPTDFPILTKGGLLENFDRIATDRTLTLREVIDFCSANHDPATPVRDGLYVVHSSGTSGQTGYYLHKREDIIRRSLIDYRLFPRQGGGRRRIAFVGATDGHFSGITTLCANQTTVRRNLNPLRVIEFNRPRQAIIDELNAFQPDLLCGYATMLTILAEAQLAGDLRITVADVESVGEPLSRAARVLLEGTFQARVVNLYATSDLLGLGFSRTGDDGMYLLEDDLIFEMGQGFICVTNLANRVMPLIRYRLDDACVVQAEGDATYPFLKIDTLVGRSEDMLYFRNEQGAREFLHPLVLPEIRGEGVKRFQIKAVSETSFAFCCQLEPDMPDAKRAQIRGILKGKIDLILADKKLQNVRYTIEEVDDIPVDPKTGKFRLVAR